MSGCFSKVQEVVNSCWDPILLKWISLKFPWPNVIVQGLKILNLGSTIDYSVHWLKIFYTGLVVWLKTLNLENEDVAHKILPYYFFKSNVFERDTLLPYLFCIYHCFVSRDLDVGWIKRVKVFHTIAYFKCVFAGSGRLSEGYWIPYSTHGCRVCQLLYQRSDADLDSWVSEPWRRNEKDCVEGKTAKEFLFFLKSGWLVYILQKWSTNLTLQTLL